MDQSILYAVVGALAVLALGGVAFAFAGGDEKTKKRVAQVSNARASLRAAKGAVDPNQQRRKNVQSMLKELEKKNAASKQRISLRRRIEMAGLTITTRTYWIASLITAIVATGGVLMSGQKPLFALLMFFAAGLGVPRWTLRFLKKRREKAFTREFANGVDIIVRSVKTGLPVNEALKVVASEIPDPVGSEFKILTEGLKVGVTLEQGLKRMYERMPTAEVNFFCIVMTIQQKTGGNLSEALGNLAGVLRDRKRLQNKIRAMSSEAKTSAMVIGALPPGVMVMVSLVAPDYIGLLYKEKIGNLMLLGCVVWMFLGVMAMKKLISFKI